MQRWLKQGGALFGSVRKLIKTSKLPLSVVRQLLPSKPSYTKSTTTTRKFNRIKALARFKNDVWCMELAYVDKLAKHNNGVNYVQVSQGLFERSVCKRRENKRFQGNGSCIFDC